MVKLTYIRQIIQLPVCFATVALLTLFQSVIPRSVADDRPNIVMVVVDDMRYDEYGAGGHTYLQTPNIDKLAEQGISFQRAYHATPLCSPNRASLLTGQYASRHGVLDNTSRSHSSHNLDLFAKDLQKAGYKTAHVGKWHMGNDPTPRPGYDYWVSFAGQGLTYDPDLYEDGRMHKVKGYITDIFSDRASSFIRESGKEDKPFFVYVGHKAIHPEIQQADDGTIDPNANKEFIPANRHKDKYAGKVFKRAPSYGFSKKDRQSKPVISRMHDVRDRVMKDEPAWVKQISPGVAEITIQRRAEMMLAVDEGIGKIVKTLEETKQLDNTVFIFTSDNGYFYGEHDLTIERRLPYEESVRAPLIIRYPSLAGKARKVDSLALSIDLAATILDAAGTEIPSHMQGKSLLPVLKGETDRVRESAYIEYYSHENPMQWTANMDYRIVRKGKYKYIHWIQFKGGDELYNLESDPNELTNLINEVPLANVVRDMKKELKILVAEAFGF